MPVRKRGGIYHGYVTVNGVRSPRKSTGCTDKKAALAVLAEWERELADPAYASSKTATVDQACNAVLKHYADLVSVGKKAPDTEAYYTEKLGTVARILTPKLPLSALREPGGALVLDEYVSARRKEEASEHTIAKELAALKLVLKHAKRAGWWNGDAAAVFPPSFSSEYEPRERTLNTEEIDAVRLVLGQDFAAQAAFSIATGAERKCIQSAQRSDVGEKYVLLRGTKNKQRWRTVPLVTETQRRLMDFAMRNAKGEGLSLFSNANGLCFAMRKACKLLGIDHASPNDLRRTFAVNMREAGFPLELIAPMMGHADTKMLQRVYGRLNPEQLRERLLTALNAVAVCAIGVQDGAESGRNDPERNGASSGNLAPRAGFEPATYGLTVRFGRPDATENAWSNGYVADEYRFDA